ncbi:hypothetical protein [Methylobacterium tardum]|uniref:Uncharacterized protein n=1 Tax=Methylobacterium tardum TaxID=374432 RepID=A0AA37THN8_9HYPH|nr:hypothetical protein [Methylobacterium tardum]URD35238.1 hypothetical protein M6G65_22295 [Methylobacterium tardum]GLS73760.1 hypothetical protein GCM10007890_57750 [Methylobacterium tardum]
MANQEDEIKRRKRAPREHIPDGEFRNITIRVSSRTYNALADAANAAGFSISDVGEKAIRSVIDYRESDKITGFDRISRPSQEILDVSTRILMTYEKHGGEKWLENDRVRVAAHYAIQAVIDRALPAPPNLLEIPLNKVEPKDFEVWTAANTGERLGAILLDPTNITAYADQNQRAPLIKKEWDK